MPPRNKKTLQAEGVPFPSKLTGRAFAPKSTGPVARRRTVRERTPIETGIMGGTRDTTTYYDYPESEGGRSRKLPNLNPAKAGGSAGGSIGGLEAEFLFAIVLLFLLMFSNSKASFGDRIMGFMKRGALTCLLFFILALVASAGPNAMKIAKAFGALIIVGILLTSPMNTVLTDVDAIIKNEWVPTNEGGKASTANQPSGGGGSGSNPSLAQQLLKALGNPVTGTQGLVKTLGSKLFHALGL